MGYGFVAIQSLGEASRRLSDGQSKDEPGGGGVAEAGASAESAAVQVFVYSWMPLPSTVSDAWVDWIGMSVFNNDLCEPFWDNGTTDWDGTENQSARTCSGYYDANVGGNINALPYGYSADFNDLDMLWFAQQHGKPVMIAESGVQRMTASLNGDGTQDDPDCAQWMNRLATLIDYRGPLPNTVINGQPTDFVGTGYNLSGVVKMVTYIDIDWRYGFDGQLTASTPFGESTTSGWFVNSLLSRYPQGRSAFCSMLGTDGFDTGCTS